MPAPHRLAGTPAKNSVIAAYFAWPAMQKTFVNSESFFEFIWGFGIEKWQGFVVNFQSSPFPRKRRTKSPHRFGLNSEQISGQNSGRKFEKYRNFRSATFLTYVFLDTSYTRVLQEGLRGPEKNRAIN